MKYPFLRHITKIRNPRGKVKYSIIYFQQFTHFFLLKTRQKNGRSVYLVQTVRSPLTDHVFIPFAPSVSPPRRPCIYPVCTVRFSPRRPNIYPVCTVRSPPRRPRIYPACTARFSPRRPCIYPICTVRPPLADRAFTPSAPPVSPSSITRIPPTLLYQIMNSSI